jgi:hypothetical protein
VGERCYGMFDQYFASMTYQALCKPGTAARYSDNLGHTQQASDDAPSAQNTCTCCIRPASFQGPLRHIQGNLLQAHQQLLQKAQCIVWQCQFWPDI